MNPRPVIVIAGAGPGAIALAADNVRAGHTVRIYTPFLEEVERLRRGVRLSGELSGQFAPRAVEPRLRNLLRGSDILVVVAPTTAHPSIVHELNECDLPLPPIILCPGNLGGAVLFAAALEAGHHRIARVFETDTIPFAVRRVGAEYVVYGTKRRVLVATDDNEARTDYGDLVGAVIHGAQLKARTLETSLGAVGYVIHPTIVLANLGRSEPYKFYSEGPTESAVRLLEAVDRERLEVAAALGVKVDSLSQWLVEAYGIPLRDVAQMLRQNRPYAEILSPGSLETRYLTQDVPNGLVPLVSLGDTVGVDARAAKALVTLAEVLLGRDFWSSGRRFGADILSRWIGGASNERLKCQLSRAAI